MGKRINGHVNVYKDISSGSYNLVGDIFEELDDAVACAENIVFDKNTFSYIGPAFLTFTDHFEEDIPINTRSNNDENQPFPEAQYVYILEVENIVIDDTGALDTTLRQSEVRGVYSDFDSANKEIDEFINRYSAELETKLETTILTDQECTGYFVGNGLIKAYITKRAVL